MDCGGGKFPASVHSRRSRPVRPDRPRPARAGDTPSTDAGTPSCDGQQQVGEPVGQHGTAPGECGVLTRWRGWPLAGRLRPCNSRQPVTDLAAAFSEISDVSVVLATDANSADG
jgi:hypothetical protein